MQQSIRANILHPYILLTLMLCISTITAAKADVTQPSPGNYCPSTTILLIVAEDLSSSLEFVMRSRAAQTRGDQTEMLAMLNAAGVTLKQASSRGAGARTALLISSTILSRVNENNDQLLAWFPLLHSALLTLPYDDARNAANDAIGRAEEILQDSQNGKPLDQLKKARHFLTCDGLDLPLQVAIKEQTRLLSLIRQHKPVVTKDYDKIVDSLRTAIAYVLDHSKI